MTNLRFPVAGGCPRRLAGRMVDGLTPVQCWRGIGVAPTRLRGAVGPDRHPGRSSLPGLL